MTTLGIALRELKGHGPVDVITRVKDFGIEPLQNAEGKVMNVPRDALVAFQAGGFRELGGTDVWEFRTSVQTPGGLATALVYARGEDLLMLRTMSKIG